MTRSLVAALLVLCTGCAADAASDTTEDPSLTGDPTYTKFAAIATQAGATVNRHGEATVVGVRGMGTDGTRHTTRAQHTFDDFVVVLKPNHTAVKIPMSTHPFETGGVAGVPDVDGDGVEDVGMIHLGLYRAVGRGTSRLVGGHPAFDVSTPAGSGGLPGTRAPNHDGIFSDAETAASDRRGDKITAILFHHANGGAPPAVGCQVFEEASILALIDAVGGSKASFDYTLVDASDVAP